MPYYKDFVRAGIGMLTDEKLDLVSNLMKEETIQKDFECLEERKQVSDFIPFSQAHCFSGGWLTSKSNEPLNYPQPKNKVYFKSNVHNRSKSVSCKNKEVVKRRKKNKNKKTHRK